jgi:hypothetical protein
MLRELGHPSSQNLNFIGTEFPEFSPKSAYLMRIGHSFFLVFLVHEFLDFIVVEGKYKIIYHGWDLV